MSETQIGQLFQQSPSRELEEVQRVNARDRAKNDVREFHETESARRVLTELGDIIQMYPNEAPRFLYIHATFGSGKTHLLKLAGFAADTESKYADLGAGLATRWSGFQTFRSSVINSHTDRLRPVFLNLLDRDASQEPPLSYLIYEGLGKELGYPTDPSWLLEWVWKLDMEYDLWDDLQALEDDDGRTFEAVLEERASLRSWLYEALPTLDRVMNTPYATPDGVKETIEAAEEAGAPLEFGPETLVAQIREAQNVLSEAGTEVEFLFGLDEVALFVGDSRQRYREFQNTMEALFNGPNPPVVGTGQYSLREIHSEFAGDVDADEWYNNQVPLEGADTEIIVRKRWLQKDDEGSAIVEKLLTGLPDIQLHSYGDIGSSAPDPVEAYPFREYDLVLLRSAMQQLITHGQTTDREYIQARALLVLMRSLFTKFGWDERSIGALVTWDELFDLLVEEMTLIPTWVQEMMDRLVATFGEERSPPVRAAKTLYLVNQVRNLPATPENVGRLMLESVDQQLDERIADVEDALDELVAKRRVFTETTETGDEEYILVDKDGIKVRDRIEERVGQIPSHQVAARLESLLRESDDRLLSEGSRHEVDIGDEHDVPLRFEYSILDTVDRAPTPEFDAVRVRLLANEPDIVASQVEEWQDVNDGRDGGEHVLTAVEVPESLLDRLQNVIAMQDVLSNETDAYPDLEAELREERRELEASVRERLDEGSVYVARGGSRGQHGRVFEDVIEERVQEVFGTTRKVLTQGITEVDDARQMAQFFGGTGEWPLTERDAEMLGVETTRREITGGWCREFVENYEDSQSVSGETLLGQTRQRGGKYRGSPRESISALLITLAAANEIALRKDSEYITDPSSIGRAVRTQGGISEVQIRFEQLTGVDPDQIREVVRLILGTEPEGSEPDEWLDELEAWVGDNSVLVKRVVRGLTREFEEDVSVETLEDALAPALRGESLSTEALASDAVVSQAETFDRARELFAPTDDGKSLWKRITAEAADMQSLYPGADVTQRMQRAASGQEVPEPETIRSYLDQSEDHRQDVLQTQYEHITGTTSSESDSEDILRALRTWFRSNESSLRTTIDRVLMTFERAGIDSLIDVFEAVWSGDESSESDFVGPVVRQQAETFARARRLLDDSDGTSLWARLQETATRLQEDYPDAPVTETITEEVSSSRPPSVERVRRLLERAEDPEIELDDGDDDEYRTDLQPIRERMDKLDDGSIVLIESIND
jgi:hypothetical protein